jgi:Zn-dependent M28 family amino/carboxypeptidase
MSVRSGGTICISLFVAICRSQMLKSPASLSTYATYFPSGEIATFTALPVVVNLESFTATKGAVALLIRSLGTDDNRLPHTGSVNYAPENAIPAAAISGPDADLLERLGQRYPSVRLRLNIATQTQTDSTSYNVIGEITGQDTKREIVMMSAHLDSWDLGTGAVDDGFGVALTMAAGALIKQLRAPPRAARRDVRAGRKLCDAEARRKLATHSA